MPGSPGLGSSAGCASMVYCPSFFTIRTAVQKDGFGSSVVDVFML